jgi:methylmalonyl-CoA mutase
MTAPEVHLDLAAEFPAATPEQWRSLVAAVLTKSGLLTDPQQPAEASLARQNYDGLRIAALYTAADLPDGGLDVLGLPGQPPYLRGAESQRAGWDVRQRHVEPDPDAANQAMLADLANGASSLWLLIGDAGLPVAQLGRALAGVHLELAPIALDAGASTAAAAAALLELAAGGGLRPDELSGTLGADPIGLAARTGARPELSMVAELAELRRDYPKLRPCTVDATVYSDAGGSDSDELAISLAVGVAYLRALTEAGLDIDAALDQLEFRYAVSADQWASIAKLRAGRRLWNRVGELCGAPAGSRGQRQHAVTSTAMMTRRDPWTNLLRATIGCFAAAVGGAQAITVAPFDAALGLPSDFGRRIARNTQSILHDESSLGRVIDPAGGSYYLESLSDGLAEVSWTKFTAIERAGGAVAALANGMLEGMLAASWQCRRANIEHRRDPITGVSEFAVAGERLLDRPAPPQADDPPPPDGVSQSPGALPRLRYAEPFENLRDRSDAHLAATGHRPTVFLAAFGPVRAHTARLSFAANLLAAGGIEAVAASGEPAELIAAFQSAATPLALLCSSDQLYAERAAELAGSLKAAGARHVWLAGPAQSAGGVDGIEGAVFAGCNAVAALRSMLDALGVPA